MITTQYAIEQKSNGHWFGVLIGRDWQEIRAEFNDLRKENPDQEYQLVKVTTHREVVG